MTNIEIAKLFKDNYNNGKFASFKMFIIGEAELLNMLVKYEELVNVGLADVRHWVDVSIPPKHGKEVLTYTPSSDISEETQRLLTYGTLMNGFPSGVTHWMVKPKPPYA